MARSCAPYLSCRQPVHLQQVLSHLWLGACVHERACVCMNTSVSFRFVLETVYSDKSLIDFDMCNKYTDTCNIIADICSKDADHDH